MAWGDNLMTAGLWIFLGAMALLIIVIVVVSRWWLNRLERRIEQEDEQRSDWYDHTENQ